MAHAEFMWHILFLSLSIALVSSQGTYRRRAGHAAVLAGDKLVLSGGLVAYERGVPVYENKTWIIDLSSSWTNESIEPTSVPRPASFNQLEYETLWYVPTTGYIYAFGGEISQDGGISNPGGVVEIPEESIWRFSLDETGNSGLWMKILGPNSRNDFPPEISRPIMGASASDNQSAYYIGGAISKWTTNKVGNMTRLHNVPGLLQFDFSSKTLTNSSNDGSYFAAKWTEPDQTMSLAGMMTYAPLFGKQGVFIVVGGQSNNTGAVEYWWQDIAIFDPDTKSWYSQKAQGDIPKTRELVINDWSANNYCAFGAQDDGLRTFDIFVFGDFQGNPNGHTYYVLSLPSFTWFASDVTSWPRRNQQTCTATHNRQMIMIGGLDPDQTNYDPQDWESTPDPWSQGIGVFDMTSLKYTDQYDADAEKYASPNMVQVYYNNSDRYPVTWDDPDMKTIFEITGSDNSSDDSSGSFSGFSKAAIAGIVIGAVIVVIFLFLILKFRSRWRPWITRKRRKAFRNEPRLSSQEPSDLPPAYSGIGSTGNFQRDDFVLPRHNQEQIPLKGIQRTIPGSTSQGSDVGGSPEATSRRRSSPDFGLQSVMPPREEARGYKGLISTHNTAATDAEERRQ